MSLCSFFIIHDTLFIYFDIQWSAGMASSSISEVFIFISQNHKLYILFSSTHAGLYMYHLVVSSNLNFLHYS